MKRNYLIFYFMTIFLTDLAGAQNVKITGLGASKCTKYRGHLKVCSLNRV